MLSDQDLMKQILERDAHAFEVLFGRYGEMIEHRPKIPDVPGIRLAIDKAGQRVMMYSEVMTVRPNWRKPGQGGTPWRTLHGTKTRPNNN